MNEFHSVPGSKIPSLKVEPPVCYIFRPPVTKTNPSTGDIVVTNLAKNKMAYKVKIQQRHRAMKIGISEQV